MASMLTQKFSAGFQIRHRDGAILTSRNQSHIYLRQGDIDLGCGIYCALMGLVFCGVISWSQGRNVAGSNRRALVAFWEEASLYFFVGTGGANIARFLKRTEPSLQVKHLPRPSRSMTVNLARALEDGLFVMARIENSNAIFDHWVVISGVQGILNRGHFGVTALLTLDPSQPAPRYSLYNGILELNPGRERHLYARNGEVRKVSLMEAVTIQLGEAL